MEKQIEVGKLYRTRNGTKVRIYATDVEGDLPIHGAVYYPEYNRWSANSWREDGVDGDYLTGFDIIGEWMEPLDFDPDCLPAWAEWIAMDQNNDWRWHRYKPERNYFFWVEPTKWEFKVGDCGRIPEDFIPKNFKGHWKESLFSVEELRKLKKK